MAISVPGATMAANQKARRALRMLDAGRAVAIDSSGDGDAESGGAAPEPVEPIPIYAPRIGARTASLKATQQTGWRYLVTDSDSIGAVDVATDGGAEAQIVSEPEVASRIARAARIVEETTDNDKDDYEMRLLDLSMVGDSVIWLSNANGADRFFTYGDHPQEVSEDDIERTIKDGARAIRANARNDDPEAGG